MSGFGSKKKNSVYPASDNTLLSIPNGTHVDGGKRQKSPKKTKLEKKHSRLWTEEIEALKPCEEFFIKQINLHTDDIHSPSYYDIRNAKGKLIFKAIESIDPGIQDAYHDANVKPPYVITIFDMKAGKEMLRINTNLRQGVMLVYVKQTSEDKIIGIVRRVLPSCPIATSSFSLERPNGAVLLTIKSSFSLANICCCCPARFARNQGSNFHIRMSDDVTHVGKIQYLRKRFDKGDDVEANRTEEMVTASFPGDTTATNKALILASLFMLDCIYFQKHRKVRKRLKISKTCSIVVTIVVVVLVIGIMAAVFGGRGFAGTRSGPGGRRPGIG